MTIHASDPFATPEPDRSPVRRLRGRLPAAVTLWTATNARDGVARPAGLTVSSTVVVDGSPGRLLGLLDEESALWEAIRESGRFAVTALRDTDRRLADAFAGLMPAPGGPFAAGSWRETGFGPVPTHAATWAGCRLDEARPVGWALLVEATIEQIEVDPSPSEPVLVHARGRYLGLPLP